MFSWKGEEKGETAGLLGFLKKTAKGKCNLSGHYCLTNKTKSFEKHNTAAQPTAQMDN